MKKQTKSPRQILLQTTILSGIICLFATFQLHAQWSVANLSEPRERPYTIVSGSKVIFAFGSGGAENKVDIYDANTGAWSAHNMSFTNESSQPDPPMVANNGRLYFVDVEHVNDIVQVYDTNTDTWSTLTLSEPREYVSIGSVGDYVIFAGGLTSTSNISLTVDVYNVRTDSWHLAQLSAPHAFVSIVGLGNKIFMAGGFTMTEMSDRVDILDTETWVMNTSTLVTKRGFMEAVTVGNKVLLAGGGLFDYVFFNDVDIYDGATGTWSSDTLTQKDYAGIMTSVVVGNKAYFQGGIGFNNGSAYAFNIVDIYDADTGAWTAVSSPTEHFHGDCAAIGGKLYLAGGYDTTGVVEVFDGATSVWGTVLGYLSEPRYWVGSAAVNNQLLIAGGININGVHFDVVDIYTGLSPMITLPITMALGPIFPNPAHQWAHLSLPADAKTMRVYDVQGRLVHAAVVNQRMELDLNVGSFLPGLYFIDITGNEIVYSGKIMVE